MHPELRDHYGRRAGDACQMETEPLQSAGTLPAELTSITAACTTPIQTQSDKSVELGKWTEG